MKMFLPLRMAQLHILLSLLIPQFGCAQELVPLNSGRPTFYDLTPSIPGKIVLEEHVTTNLFNPAFTTPFFNNTNEIFYGQPAYIADVGGRLTGASIAERVHQMDISNISISVVSLGPPAIQGIFNKTFAIEMASAVNDQIYANYSNGQYAERFAFFCNAALQDPVSAAKETERCVKKLGGVGVMVGGYTNNGSVNEVVYLDDPINEPFWKMLNKLDVPLYLHPRMPPPNQQRVYEGYGFLAGSPWGFSSETAAHALRLMVSGVFDRYPKLQVILGHCGEGLPFSLARIDQRMRHFQPLWPAKKTMSYYWENNFHVTTAGVQDEAALENTVRVSGEDRVMFSVDYPFEDDVEIAGWFDRVELAPETKDKIAFSNARKLLKLRL
jgi:gamma-resorcylate decarboxylase